MWSSQKKCEALISETITQRKQINQLTNKNNRTENKRKKKQKKENFSDLWFV